MNAPVHGIELGEDGKPSYLCLGILDLLYYLCGANSPELSNKEWLSRFHSAAFRHHVAHFLQCFRKFDRAAGHVTRCREDADGALGRWNERVRQGKLTETFNPLSDPDHAAMMEVNMEFPLFLDSMLFYLRIQADAYAKLVPYFHKNVIGGPISTRSFRFAKAENLGCDPEYISVLKTNSAWFDRLAGKEPKKGLRDVVIHHGGILAVGWAKPEDSPIESRTALYGSSGIVEQDVFGALREITAGWYALLDAAWHHFVPRLTEAGILLPMSANDVETSR